MNAILLAPLSVEDEVMATDILVKALVKGQGTESRCLAAWGMCAIGGRAEDAALGLRRVLNDEDFFVRVCAAYALGTTSPKHKAKALVALRNAARADAEEITSKGLPLMIDGTVSACLLLGLDQRHLLLLEGLLRNRHPFPRFPTPFLIDEALACLQKPHFRLADPETKEALVARWRRLPITALEDLDPVTAREERAGRRKVERALAEKAARERAEQEKQAQREARRRKAEEEARQRKKRETRAEASLDAAIKFQNDPQKRATAIKWFKKVVEDYPDTPAAAEAKKRLRQLGEK